VTAGAIAARSIGRRHLVAGIYTGGVMLIVCTLVSLMSDPHSFPSGWNAVLLLVLLGGGALGGMLSAAKPGKRRR
jgi:putative membrane protein (TIGR04086 family)